jgi:hypothetical protein
MVLIKDHLNHFAWFLVSNWKSPYRQVFFYTFSRGGFLEINGVYVKKQQFVLYGNQSDSFVHQRLAKFRFPLY